MKKRELSDDTESLITSRSHSRAPSELLEYLQDEDEQGESRRILHAASPFNSLPHVFNLANCIIGVSILAMPFVFQRCGILLAVVMIMFCSILTKFTCHFLVKAAFLSRMRSYESLALTAMGKSGRWMTEISLLCFLMSSVIAFLVVIGDLGPHIAADYLELEAPTQRLRVLIMILTVLLVVFPLSLIKDLEKFAIVSSVAVVFYAAFVVRMIFQAIPSLIEGKWSVSVLWWRSEGFLPCLPIICMAMSCQTQLFCVIDCIKDASTARVDTVVNNAVNFCSAMYAAVGLFGYVAFYSKELHGDVLVELEPTLFTQLLKLCFMLSIAFSIPLMLFPLRTALFNLILRPSGCELPAVSLHPTTFHILTVFILTTNTLVAILIPNVEFILGLTGSLIGSIVSTILPCIFFIYITGKKGHSSLPIAKICLVIGIFMLLMSTWATLQSDRKSNVVEKPKPKDSLAEKPDLESLERLEEKVLDANINISQKLNDIAGLAAKGKDKEAERLIVEMKEQQKEQKELLRKQEQIVQHLNQHMEKHRTENYKSSSVTSRMQQKSIKPDEIRVKSKPVEKVEVADDRVGGKIDIDKSADKDIHNSEKKIPAVTKKAPEPVVPEIAEVPKPVEAKEP